MGFAHEDGAIRRREYMPSVTARRVAGVIVAAFATVWLLHNWTRIGAPLGFSHDGQNAGVFGSAARALVADPIGSHLGSRLADGNGVYANHPPLIGWLLALGHLVLGDDPAGLRLPMVAAALLLVAATYRLLRALVTTPWAAGVGTVAGLGAPMFFVYGTMPDTPMLGLPFGVLLLGEVVVAEREPGRPRWGLVASAAGCGLAGWEGVLFAAVVAAVALARARRDPEPTPRRPVGASILAGLAGGVGVTVAWIAWADGGLGRLADQFLFRTGASTSAVGVGGAVSAQLDHLADVYGLLLPLALLAAIPAMRVPSVRRHLPVVAAVCVVYHLGFWQGATYHDYWPYWWQLPMAMALAGALEAGATSTVRLRPATAAMAAALVVVGPLLTLVGTSGAERDATDGLAVANLLSSAHRPDDQNRIVLLGLGPPNSWASWSTHLPVQEATVADVRRIAATHPRWSVVVHCRARLADGSEACDRLPDATPRAADVAVVGAAALVAAID